MKRVLLMILSIVLVLACVFSLMRVVPGVQDILNIKDYKNGDSAVANDGVAQLEDGIAQLKENEQTYLDGVVTYVDGEAQLAAGRQELAAGEKQLAEGQAMIDANTQAYLEGKELIGKMESLMPTIESLAGAIQNVRDFNAGIIGGDADMYLGQLRANVLNTLANGQAIAALSEVVGMDIAGILASNPTDTSILGNVVNMYYDGLAQLKQYEDGLAQLADGKQQLAAGRQQLAAGEAQLADGNAQLTMFEDGEAQLADGIITLMLGMAPSYHPYSHEQTVDSLAERLAAEFDIDVPDLYVEDCDANADAETISYANCFNMDAYKELCNAVLENLYQKDENGDFICAERDGKSLTLLDLDKCDLVVENAKAYLEDSEADVYGEVIPRVVSYALVAIAAVLGVIAGLMGLIAGITGGKKTGKGLGIAAAIMAVGGFVAAIISHYTDLIYGIRVLEGTTEYAITDSTVPGTDVIYSGNALAIKPFFLIMVIAAILFVIAAAIAKKAAKEKASKEAVAVEASSAAVAGAADAERVAKLESENAELKAMVAEMAADAATVKD